MGWEKVPPGSMVPAQQFTQMMTSEQNPEDARQLRFPFPSLPFCTFVWPLPPFPKAHWHGKRTRILIKWNPIIKFVCRWPCSPVTP